MNKYVSVRQSDMSDCGVACVATIAKYYGKDVSISKIREATKTDSNGSTIFGVKKSLNDLGFDTKSVKVDTKGFLSKFTLPAIAHIKRQDGYLHFVVIYKINKKYVLVSDPEIGIKKIKTNVFLQMFTGSLLLAVPAKEFVKGKNKENVIGSIFKIIVKHKRLFVYIFTSTVVLTLFGFISSFSMKYLIDEVLANQLLDTLKIFGIGMIVFYIFNEILTFCKNHLILHLGQKMDIELLSSYYEHILKLPMKFFSTRKVGEIITRFSDAMTIKDILSGTLVSIIIDIFMVIGVGAVLCAMNSKLFLVNLAIILASTLLIFIFKKPYAIYNQKMMEQNAKMSSILIETLAGVETVKISGVREKQETKISEEFAKLLNLSYQTGILSNAQGLLGGLLNSIGGLAVLWVGAYEIINGKMSLGDLLAFNSLTSMFLGPVGNLISLQMSFQEVMISARRLMEILFVETEEEKDDNKLHINNIDSDILIKDLTFNYGYRKDILKNVNIEIKKGSKVGIVGETGCGKTTLAKLLLGFEEADEGFILINDIDIKSLKVEKLRERIAYVPQNSFLFSGKIIDNLRMGSSSKSENEIIEVCKELGIHDFIAAQPNGYNTIISEYATNLSGGQKQRLTIARALLKEADIIILDEATSQLDVKTEKFLKEKINHYYKDKTMIIIAHRLSTIQNCNLIYVLDEGRVVEAGDHESLIKKHGYYYELYNSQIS